MSNSAKTMPKAIADLFYPLSAELVGIYERWALYQRAFGFEETRVTLLNRVADIFFGCAQWGMYIDVVLALCRYTDPAESSKKIGHRPNMTLERLVNAVAAHDALFGRALEAGEWTTAKNYRQAHFENIRSKRLAHNDFAHTIARFNGQPMGWPSREQVNHLLECCTKLMQKVHEQLVGCPFAFDANTHFSHRSADVLIDVLSEFADRHDAEVLAGKRTWAIRPPVGFFASLCKKPG